MDDILIEKINTFVKDKCSRVPHNIGLDILKIVNKNQETLTTSSVSQRSELLAFKRFISKTPQTEL